MTGDRELWRLAVTNFNSRHIVRDMMSENRNGICLPPEFVLLFDINIRQSMPPNPSRVCRGRSTKYG